jgi:fructokinase
LILVAGEALVDVFPEGSVRPGGSPFNVAVGLARLGARVTLATRIGDDAFGRLLLAALEREGVGTRHARISSGPTASATVTLESGGAPRYRFAGLAETEAWFAPPLEDSTCLHAGSYALVAPRSSAALLDLFDAARPGVLLSVDPNVRLAMAPAAELWRSAFDSFAARAHLVKMSEEDVGALAGPAADIDAFAAAPLSHRCALVALTRGARGASLFSRRHGRLDGAAPPVAVVDTVGAGDSFQAALLAGLDGAGVRSAAAVDALAREHLQALLDTALAAGALTCARAGADPPTRAELGPAVKARADRPG